MYVVGGEARNVCRVSAGKQLRKQPRGRKGRKRMGNITWKWTARVNGGRNWVSRVISEG